MARFEGDKRPQKGRSSFILLFQQRNSAPCRSRRLFRPEIITPKLVSLPEGTSGLLRYSIRCQLGSRRRRTSSPDGPSRPCFRRRCGRDCGSRLPAHRLVLAVTLEPGFPINRLGCLVLPPCSLHQSVAVLRTKVLQCLSSCSEKLSSSSYTGNGRGAVHRGNVTCLYLRAAPSEIDA